MQHRELRTDRGSRFVNGFFLKLSLFNILGTSKEGDRSSWRLPQARLPHQPWHLQLSSDSVIRRARGALCGIDSYPASVSSKHDARKERRDLLTKPTKNPEPNKNEDPDRTERPVVCWHPGVAARIRWQTSLTQRLTRQSFSWTIFRAYACEKCGFG